MNRKELIERLSERSGLSSSEAQRFFQAFEQAVVRTLTDGEEVRITGFGKFYVQERKAREGRNPRTGEKMQVRASKNPAFSAGSTLKEAI